MRQRVVQLTVLQWERRQSRAAHTWLRNKWSFAQSSTWSQTSPAFWLCDIWRRKKAPSAPGAVLAGGTEGSENIMGRPESGQHQRPPPEQSGEGPLVPRKGQDPPLGLPTGWLPFILSFVIDVVTSFVDPRGVEVPQSHVLKPLPTTCLCGRQV